MYSYKNQNLPTVYLSNRQYDTSFHQQQIQPSSTERSISRPLLSQSFKIPHQTINNIQIIFSGRISIRIKQKLDQLLQSVEGKYKTVYGINIEEKNELKSWEKAYLCGCYWLLNFEPIKPQQLQEIISKKSEIVDDIRIQCGQIKFDKKDNCLIYCRQNESLRLGKKQYNLQIFGYPSYERSLIMITLGGMSYRFDSLIMQVQCLQNMIAIRTQCCIYVIHRGKVHSWNIKCGTIKWGRKGLYFLQDGGKICMIKNQIQYLTKKITFQLSEQSLGSWKQNDFLASVNGQIILVSVTRKQIILKAINSLQTKVNLMDLDQSTTIYYVNGYESKQQLIVFFITGSNGRIEQINEFSFIIV